MEAAAVSDARVSGRGRRRNRAAARFLLARTLQGAVVLLGAIVVSFALTELAGNPAEVLGGSSLTAEQVAQLSRELGYDRPVLERFGDYMAGIAHGDLGSSFRFNEPAITTVLHALPYTLGLVFGAIALATLVAVGVAVHSVLHRESLSDRAVRRVLIVGQGVPEFWLGLVLVLVFAVALGWAPSVYSASPSAWVLPLVTLATPLCSMLVRVLRVELLDVMGADFVTALRGRGLSDRQILLRHGMRNATIPFLHFLGLQIGWLMGGTIIVEAVFVWPGIGSLLLGAVETRDLPVIQAIVVVVALVYVVVSVVVDLLTVAIDPRIRIGGAGS